MKLGLPFQTQTIQKVRTVEHIWKESISPTLKHFLSGTILHIKNVRDIYSLFDSNWIYGKLLYKRQVHIKDCTMKNLHEQPPHHKSAMLHFLALRHKECKTKFGQIFNQSRSNKHSHRNPRSTPSTELPSNNSEHLPASNYFFSFFPFLPSPLQTKEPNDLTHFGQ